MAQLEFGTAIRDITPAYPVWAHGYSGRTERSRGVREPLSLGCLAVSDGTRRVVIVTLDMIGVRGYVCDELYALIAKETGVTYPDVLISGSHTHFAPALHRTSSSSPEIALVDPDPKYVEDVKTKLVEAVRESLRRLRPAQLETVRLQVPAILFNRRTRKDDGLVHNCLLYPEDAAPYTFSPVDSELTVLRVWDDDGIRAVLLNFGCHPVTGCSPDGENYRFSADYPFYVRQTIADKWRCPVFFTLGTAGDSVPINRRDDCRERLGNVLGNSAILAERTYSRDPVDTVDAEVVHVEAETILTVDPATAEAEYVAAREQCLALARDAASDAANGAATEAFSHATTRYERSLLYPENRAQIGVQFVRIGSTVFVGLPFEVLAEISLKMKERNANSVLVSCAGGYQGYLPLEYEYPRGGYEASEWSTHFVPGTADRLLETILNKLGE